MTKQREWADADWKRIHADVYRLDRHLAADMAQYVAYLAMQFQVEIIELRQRLAVETALTSKGE